MAGKNRRDRFGDLADSLIEESLKEAADTFFGQRKEIETALEVYKKRVQELQTVHHQVSVSMANLHFLLRQGEAETAASFYRQLGLDPEQVPRPDPDVSADLSRLRPPFTLRAKTRYVKLVVQAYAQLSDQVAVYMNGQVYNDPEEPRRKRVTVNYRQLAAFCLELQEKIRQANQYNSPTQLLQFVKQLDAPEWERESQVGVPLHYTLDTEMAFTPPDLAAANLPAYPDFPPLKEVKSEVARFATRIFTQYPGEMKALLDKIKALK